MSNSSPAAGWFADPHDPSRLRWWDGATWTDHVHPPLAPEPVLQVAAVPVPVPVPVPHATDVPEAAAQQEERILEEYYGNEEEPSMFGFTSKLRLGGVSFGSGRSQFGKATISEVGSIPRSTDQGAERARMAELGMEPEQIDSALAVQEKMASLIEKAEGNPIASKVAHKVLRKLAFSTARGGHRDAMDIVFDGRRYHAYGGMHSD